MTSIVLCLCSVMLYDVWSGRRNALHECNAKAKTEEEEAREVDDLVGTEFSESCPELKHTGTHTLSVSCCSLTLAYC